MKLVRSLVTALGISLSSALPGASQRASAQEKKLSLEDSVKVAIAEKLSTEEKPVDAETVQLQRIDTSAAHVQTINTWPKEAQTVSKSYQNATRPFWYGLAVVEGQKHAALVNEEGVRILQPISPLEEQFIRAVYSFGSTKPKQITVPSELTEEVKIDEYVSRLAEQARKSLFADKITDEIINKAKAALNASRSNKLEYLAAMGEMTHEELVFAFHLLPRMNTPEYSFRGPENKTPTSDLATQTRDTFYDNVHAAGEALKVFPWTMDQAKADFDAFMSRVVDPRFNREFMPPAGFRTHLLRAMEILLKGETNVDRAVERSINGINAIFGYAGGSPREECNLVDLTNNHLARGGVMAQLALFLRAAGISATMVYTPAYADGEGNSVWNFIQVTRQDGTKEVYGLLLGENTFRGKKRDLHYYDGKSPRFGNTPGGWPRLAKAYSKEFTLNGPEQVDVTDKLTATTTVTFALDPSLSGRTAYLNVLNFQGPVTVSETAIGDSGEVQFEDVGCTPNFYEWLGDRVKSDGLVYTVSLQKNTFDTTQINALESRVVSSDNNYPVKPATNNNHAKLVDGLLPKTTYRINKLFRTEGGTELREVKGLYTTNEKGVVLVPAEVGNLIWVQSLSRTNPDDEALPLQPDGKDSRPYVIQDGFDPVILRAIQH